MRNDVDIHHRRSIRLKGYDYSRAGAYFVTICLQGLECLLGQVVREEMELNDAGRMIERWWLELPDKYAVAEINAAAIMPNHFHGIILITDDAVVGHPHRGAPTDDPVGAAVDGDPAVGAALRVRPPNAGLAIGGHPTTGHPHRGAPTDDPVGVAVDGDPAVGAALRGRADLAEGDGKPTLGQIVGWFKTMTTNEYIRGVKEWG
jgi:putative transposase